MLTKTDTDLLKEAAALGILANLRGRIFVFTGTLSMTRAELTKLIQACGGRVEDRVRYPGTTLVCGQQAYEGRWTQKMQDARSQGATVVGEDDLVKILIKEK
jgi:NAD-dependent DNA ligase